MRMINDQKTSKCQNMLLTKSGIELTKSHGSMRFFSILVIFLTFFLLLTSCGNTTPRTIILATTTSTEQTGLLAAILPEFTAKTGIEVKVVAVGTGQAIELGKAGEADVLLVHDTSSEETFVQEGYGPARYDVMYNDFVLVGPDTDPLEIKLAAPTDITDAFLIISEGNTPFISRGDKSGTHKKEQTIWKAVGQEPSGKWYISAGKGMGEVLQMADEMQGYTLTDRGTWLSMAEKLELKVIVEGDKNLFNQYGVIPVNTDAYKSGKSKTADTFVEWILSDAVQHRIGEFGQETYGQSLFIPNAKN